MTLEQFTIVQHHLTVVALSLASLAFVAVVRFLIDVHKR